MEVEVDADAATADGACITCRMGEMDRVDGGGERGSLLGTVRIIACN